MDKSRSSRAGWRYPHVSVTSTDLEIVNELQRLLGGAVISRHPRKEGYKPCYAWKLNGSVQVLKLLAKVLPLLRCPAKRARAEFLLLHYPKYSKRNGVYTEAEKEIKRRFEEDFLAIGVS